MDTGRTRFAFKSYPLESVHPSAMDAAAAAECARRQGLFWLLHDALFESYGSYDTGFLDRSHLRPDLNAASFESCVRGPVREFIRRGVEDARQAGIVATPTFLFGELDAAGDLVSTARINGSRPLDEFRAALDGLLAGVESR